MIQALSDIVYFPNALAGILCKSQVVVKPWLVLLARRDKPTSHNPVVFGEMRQRRGTGGDTTDLNAIRSTVYSVDQRLRKMIGSPDCDSFPNIVFKLGQFISKRRSQLCFRHWLWDSEARGMERMQGRQRR